MKKARLTTGIVLLILLASLIPWPQAMAITPQDQTISITDTHDDLFITETGIGIDSQLCHILDPNMDVRSFLVFRELEINFWEPLKNATLRFRTTSTLDFDADSRVTVYGMRYSDLQREGWLNPGWVLSVPLTSASVDVNTSQFSGQTWHEVDVTAIVEELIRSYDWDGDGADGTETGDAIGFIIYGAEGYDTRWFIDYLYGTPSLASQLVLHWNWEPPPPVDPPENGDPEFVETYGDNYTIWRLPGGVGYSLEPMEYVFTNGTVAPFNLLFDNLTGVGPFQVAETGLNTFGGTKYGGRRLIRTSNGTLWTTYVRRTGTTNQLFTKKSLDNGTTWIDETQIGSDWTHASLSCGPSIAVDGLDNIHLTWWPYDGSFFNISYSMYNGTWSAPIAISGGLGREGFDQRFGVIAIDPSNNVHIMWGGYATGYPTDEIWHRAYNGSWGPTTRVSTYAGMQGDHQKFPSFTIDSNDVIHAVWAGEVDPPYSDDQVWYSNYTDEWSYPLRLSTRLHPYHERTLPSIAVDSNDVLHVVWTGKDYAVGPPHNIFYVNSSNAWGNAIILPEVPELSGDRFYPSIAVDSNDSLHVAWSTQFGDPLGSVAYTNYTDDWLSPAIDLQSGISYKTEHPKFRWARWPIPGDASYFITDENGTVVQEDLDSLDDAEDWIDTEDPDPEDPNPPDWPETGYFIRFKMRLYFLAIGFGCLFGPILFFAWRRPSGYYLGAGFILMLIGLGFLLTIGQV